MIWKQTEKIAEEILLSKTLIPLRFNFETQTSKTSQCESNKELCRQCNDSQSSADLLEDVKASLPLEDTIPTALSHVYFTPTK